MGVGIVSRLLRRMGYVRLRDYNLRPTADGNLAVIDSRRPLPIDFGRPAVQQLSQWPEIPTLAEPPPIPRNPFAEGTEDGLEPVTRQAATGTLGNDTKPLRAVRERSKSDTIPEPNPWDDRD